MKTYICIDLKSFYASVECVERKLDPLDTNLVVADNERTEKTICLAVTPSLKEYGLKGRSRLFEVVSKVNKINQERKKECKRFTCKILIIIIFSSLIIYFFYFLLCFKKSTSPT